VAVIDDVSLRGEGSHAVAKQDQRQVGIFITGELAQTHHVLHEQFKTAFAEFPEMRWRASGEAVPPVTVGVNRQSGRNEKLDGAGITPRVLAPTVRDLNNGAGWTATVPTRAREAQSVRVGQPKPFGRRVRGIKTCHGTSPALLALEIHRP
jgi:hypothetical protein